MLTILSVNLRKARTHKGWTQEKIAHIIGIPRTNYESYEAGRATPAPSSLVKIARALDVTDLYSLVIDENFDPTASAPLHLRTLIDEKYSKLLPKEKKIVDILLDLDR